MEEYSRKKKDLLDEIHQVTNKDPVISEYVSLHKEILDTKDRLTNKAHVKSIQNKLQSLSSTVDDVVVTACIKEMKCPLTQEKIKMPFYSTCGHVFERRAVGDYLKSNQNICPHVGCKGRVVEKF